jgi:A/G-specific adenine glycosylase
MIWKPLAAWYRAQGRDLPWRRTEDPYRIAVSEFMLQQTQVDRVVPLYQAFLKDFPSWKRLAEAPQADVVRAWKGLGYNMRAVRLKKLAEGVVTRFGGELPSDEEALLGLHGIGPYTARALRVFAFRQKALAPDTNLRRVLTRVFKGPKADPKAFDVRAWARWEATLPQELSYDVNQGLMDLGATVCKAGRPRCEECPISRLCASYPKILSMKTLPKQKAARTERVDRLGVPDRIYRGRVIEALREGPKPAVAFKGYTRVLAGLERDGLIRNEDGRWVLA